MIYADVIAVGVSGALVSWFYNQCLQEGMIFERFGEFLQSAPDRWYKSILGGCIYCNSVYVTGLMLFLYLCFPVAWVVFAAVGLSFFLIGLIDRHGML